MAEDNVNTTDAEESGSDAVLSSTRAERKAAQLQQQDEYEQPTSSSAVRRRRSTGTSSDNEMSSEKAVSTGQSHAYTKDVGTNYPSIRINDKWSDEYHINYCEITNTGFLPKISLSITDKDSNLSKENTIIEGANILFFIKSQNATYKSIRIDFIITSVTHSGQRGNLATPYTLFITGEMYVPNMNNASISFELVGTSYEMLKSIAQKCSLGFFSNMNTTEGANLKDKQMWHLNSTAINSPYTEEVSQYIPSQEPYSDTNFGLVLSHILNICAHAYNGPTSFFDCWIDFYYGLTFIDVNKQLGVDGLDEKIDTTPLQKALTKHEFKDGNSNTSQEKLKSDAKNNTGPIQLKILSNVPGDITELSPFKIVKYNGYSIARLITDVIGINLKIIYTEASKTANKDKSVDEFQFAVAVNETKLKNGFYILIGPGRNLTYNQGDILDTYVVGNKMIKGGELTNTMADDDYSKIAATGNNNTVSGQNHKFYNLAPVHNAINLLLLQKKGIEVTTNGLNFAMMRGEKIPVLICNMDRLNLAISSHPSTIMQRGLIEEYSGWFYIDGITYTYSPNNQLTNGTDWTTKLKLVRREWPIPGESSFPYELDSIRQGEKASGVVVVSTDHSAGTILESINELGEDLIAFSRKDVPTTGLADFMLTLYDLLNKYFSEEYINLAEGRLWAVDEEGKRAEGLPWVMWGDLYKVMDHDGNIMYMKTSISNHFFGEAFNVAAPTMCISGDGDKISGPDYILTEIYDNDIILQYMYKNGISAYKEKIVYADRYIETVHFGTNTSELEEFWGNVFNARPSVRNMYSAYYEWNVHNTTDPRKLIYQEDPALQPKKEEETTETTTTDGTTTEFANINGPSGNASASSGSDTPAGWILPYGYTLATWAKDVSCKDLEYKRASYLVNLFVNKMPNINYYYALIGIVSYIWGEAKFKPKDENSSSSAGGIMLWCGNDSYNGLEDWIPGISKLDSSYKKRQKLFEAKPTFTDQAELAANWVAKRYAKHSYMKNAINNYKSSCGTNITAWAIAMTRWSSNGTFKSKLTNEVAGAGGNGQYGESSVIASLRSRAGFANSLHKLVNTKGWYKGTDVN